MSGPTARVLQLLALLQSHRFWPGTELAERLEVSGRTLRRDVERLRDLGYQIDATPGVAGGYRLAAGTHLPPLLLDDDEAVAIAVGLRAAAEASIDGIEDTALRAMVKLEQILPHRLRRQANAVHSNVVSLRWSDTRSASIALGALSLLAQACRDHEEVRFDYERRDGEAARRLVQPHQLVSAGRRWYLLAWDLRRHDWRTFRLDRLASPALAGARFTARAIPGGDAAAYVARSLDSLPRPHQATLTVGASADEVSRLWMWVRTEIEPAPAQTDGCRVTLRTDSAEWLILGVARLAAAFEVTDCRPAEVASSAAELGRSLARLAAPGAAAALSPTPRLPSQPNSRGTPPKRTVSGLDSSHHER